MQLTDYPLSQYAKNGKVDLQKVVSDSNIIQDHTLIRLLLYVCEDQQNQIKKLKAKKDKAETGGADGD